MADAVVLTSGNRMKRVLGIRDFLLLWIGQGTSMLGDQFQSIAAAWLAMAILFVLGVMNGYLAIFLITGLQRNTPQAILGRLMSMVLLGNLAFMPLSQAMAGVILRWNVPALFLVSGGLLGGCMIYLAVPQIGLLLSAGLAANQTSTVKVNHNDKTSKNSNG
jgi:hypothetical protein